MLIMSRREGETILIGDDISIVITHIGRSKVKVGISAPRELPVVAREVRQVCDENVAAAAATSAASLRGLLARLQPPPHIEKSVPRSSSLRSHDR